MVGLWSLLYAAALAQGLFGATILRWPTQTLSFAGIWPYLIIIVLYVVTRTSGVPLGPYAGMIENPGVLDMTAAELGLVIALVTMLGGACRRWTINALLFVGAALWVFWLVGVPS